MRALHGAADPEIGAIVSDSRAVTPGALFVAYAGLAVDGHRFIGQALERGAAAVVCERRVEAPVPVAEVEDGRRALGYLAAAWYGYPSRGMPVAGVTGTDGKTTTSTLLWSILRAAGRRPGLISTVSAMVGDRAHDTGLHTTTPDAPDVQRLLAEMRDAGADVAVLEVTSHGLAQQRLAGCIFDVAVVTNITHEHLDFHGSLDAYRAAKAMLFGSLMAGERKPGQPKTAILNRDDSSYALLRPIPAERYISYSAGGAVADAGAVETTLSAHDLQHTPQGLRFVLEARVPGEPEWSVAIATPLIGFFNVSNILAAAGAALALGVPPDALAPGVAAVEGIPGRMERIFRGQPFTAIVDFAHTPYALQRALETAREMAGETGRVIVVFGSAGLRDREKRRMMGDVAARLADYTVITAEDPRTEELEAIMAETAGAMRAAGREQGRDFVLVGDRQRAILHAVESARPGDVLLVCGKGHEQSMCFGVTEHPWRDQDALRWALDRHQGRAGQQPPFILPTWGA